MGPFLGTWMGQDTQQMVAHSTGTDNPSWTQYDTTVDGSVLPSILVPFYFSLVGGGASPVTHYKAGGPVHLESLAMMQLPFRLAVLR